MTTHQTDSAAQLDLPVTVHFVGPVAVHLSSGSMFGDARVFGHGEELDVSATVVEANADRNGDSWLRDWLASGEDTYTRGGVELIRRGPWPEGACRHAPGSWEWQDAREKDLREVHEITNPAEREARRRWIHSHYGAAPVTSRTLFHEPGQATR